jgi:crossover junction endodeoxyribonuclease RuvC
MISMGLDLSTKTGVSIVECIDGKIEILHAEQLRAPTGLTGMRRAGAIAQKIMILCEQYKPTHVTIEDYAIQFAGAAIVLIEIGAIVRYFLHQEGYDNYITPTPGCLKKFCTGNGAAQKDTMIKEVYKRWGYDTDSNDVADAITAAVFGCAVAGEYSAMPKVSMEAVDGFLNPKPKKKKKGKIKNEM